MPPQSPRSVPGKGKSVAMHPASQEADGLAEVRRRLCQVVSEISTHGWCRATSGNFSLTLSHEPLRLLITPSGWNKRRVGPGNLVVVGADGKAAEGEAGKPSAEALLHCTVAKETGAGSVLHTHSVAGTLLGQHFLSQGGFTITDYEMLKALKGIRCHEAEVFVPVLANSQDMPALSRKVEALLGKKPGPHGFLLAGHGLYTWGEDLDHAQRHLEALEFLFECLSRRIRFAPFDGSGGDR